MGENTDKLKGHVKETAGDITDDKDLEREGKVDRASGTVKGKIDEFTDKLKHRSDPFSASPEPGFRGRRRVRTP